MASRHELNENFIDILDTRTKEDTSVYFQPPESKKMVYPCIRYARSDDYSRHANNKIYFNVPKYEGVVIDYNPDSEIPKKILEKYPMCRFGKPYTVDTLHHFPFTIFN